jgi:hypothetical protein
MSGQEIEQLIQASPERPSDREHVFLYWSVPNVTHKGFRRRVFLALLESHFRVEKPKTFARGLACFRTICWDAFRTVRVSQVLVFQFGVDVVSIIADDPPGLVASVVSNLITIFSPSEFNPQILTDFKGSFQRGPDGF